MKISDLKIRRKGVVDMSAAGIAARLAALDELYELGMSLRQAKWIGSVKEPGAGGERHTHRKHTDPKRADSGLVRDERWSNA